MVSCAGVKFIFTMADLMEKVAGVDLPMVIFGGGGKEVAS
jgi:hypothetical protein